MGSSSNICFSNRQILWTCHTNHILLAHCFCCGVCCRYIPGFVFYTKLSANYQIFSNLIFLNCSCFCLMWHSAAGQWFSLCSTSFLDLLGVRKLSLPFWVHISSHSHQGIHRRPDCSSVLVHSSLSLESVWKNTYMALLWFAVCTEGFPSQTLSCGPLVWLLSAHWNPPLRGV